MWKWKESPLVIARLIPKTDIRGILRQDVIIGPGEAAVIIRNGVIEDFLTGTRMKNVGGGFRNWMAKKLSVGEDLQLLFITTTPIDLDLVINTTSKNYGEIKGTCTNRIQFTKQNAVKTINFMGRNQILVKNELEKKLESELVAKVFSNRIAKFNTEEFHGNLDIQKDIETNALLEMRKTFELWGINLITLFTSWEKSDYDELMEYKNKVHLAIQKRDINLEAILRDLERPHEISKKKIEQKWDLKKRDVLGEEDIKTTRLTHDIGRDEMKASSDLGVGGRKFDEQLRQQKSQWELEDQQDEVELKRMMDLKGQMDALKIKKFQETELAQQKADMDFKTQQMAMQTGSTERIMEQAIKGGVADSDALKEMMRQQTMQKMADREVEKVRATSEVEKARYDLDTYNEAEDRERKQQLDVMDASSKMMNASKQNVPQTLVQGTTATPVKTPIFVQPVTPKEEDLKCTNCGNGIKQGWKACPGCGESL